MKYFIQNPKVAFGSGFASSLIKDREYKQVNGVWYCYYRVLHRVVFCGSGMRKIDAYRDFLSNIFRGKVVGKDHPCLFSILGIYNK